MSNILATKEATLGAPGDPLVRTTTSSPVPLGTDSGRHWYPAGHHFLLNGQVLPRLVQAYAEAAERAARSARAAVAAEPGQRSTLMKVARWDEATCQTLEQVLRLFDQQDHGSGEPPIFRPGAEFMELPRSPHDMDRFAGCG